MRETNTKNVTQAECAFPFRSDGDLGCGSNPCPGQHQLPLRYVKKRAAKSENVFESKPLSSYLSHAIEEYPIGKDANNWTYTLIKPRINIRQLEIIPNTDRREYTTSYFLKP